MIYEMCDEIFSISFVVSDLKTELQRRLGKEIPTGELNKAIEYFNFEIYDVLYETICGEFNYRVGDIEVILNKKERMNETH